MELRTYQLEAIEQLREGFRKKNQRIVLCLPTGAGKTVIFSEMVKMAAEKGTRTLVLTDRIELFDQTFRSIEKKGIKPEVLSPDHPLPHPSALIIVAMVETLFKRQMKGAISLDPGLIICDEAHKGNFTKILDLFPDCRVIGVTATPVGKHFHKYYQDIVCNTDIKSLIRDGYLMPCRSYQMEDDLSDLEVAKTGDYTDKSLFTHYNTTKLYEGVVSKYLQYTPGSKALCFNVNIAHSEVMAQHFRQKGISCESLTSTTPAKIRAGILERFHTGETMVISNCGVLTTGFDEPSIQTILMNRATLSLPLYLQCLGRGSRPYPGKERFTLLDFGLNIDRHGLYQDDRFWSLDPPKKKKEGVAPVKKCPECDCMMHAKEMICPGCGYEFPEPIKPPTPKGVLVLKSDGTVSSAPSHKRVKNMTVDELATAYMRDRIKFHFVCRVLRARGEDALKEFEKKMNYSKGWSYHQIRKKFDCKFNNILIEL